MPFLIYSDNRIIWFFTKAWEGSSLGARLRTRKVREAEKQAANLAAQAEQQIETLRRKLTAEKGE